MVIALKIRMNALALENSGNPPAFSRISYEIPIADSQLPCGVLKWGYPQIIQVGHLSIQTQGDGSAPHFQLYLHGFRFP